MVTGLSVIVPSFNPGSIIDKCLKAIDAELRSSGHSYEVIVIDSSPQAPLLPQLANLILYHSNDKLFASEARNLGARIAKYSTLVFIDADVIILPDAIQRLINPIQDDVDGVGGVYEIHNANTSRVSTYQDLFLLFRYKNIPKDKNFFSSAQFAIRKEAFWKAGGFSENLQSYEDVDLGFKLQKKFIKINVCLDSRGYHMKNFSLKSIFKDYHAKTRNMVFYRLRNLNNLNWSDTFLTKGMRVSYYLVFCYFFLFLIIAAPGGATTISLELSMLGFILLFDICLLTPFLIFVWTKTRRSLWVLGAFIFFKATTIPIIFGTSQSFYKFFKNDDSIINSVKSPHDISTLSITKYSE